MVEALVGVHVRGKQRGEVSHARLLAANEVAEGVSGLAARIAEDVLSGFSCHHALMNMHRAARRVRERLGHADHNQPVLERDLLEQVLEQKGLVGQQ